MDPFVAEIRPFCFNFAPKGWAFCHGQILPISQNTALFSLLGTTYGGDGKSTFALPNLQGCAPMHWGQAPGLSLRDLGETGGQESVTLIASELPAHNHPLSGTSDAGDSRNPATGSAYALSTNSQGATGGSYYAPGNPTVALNAGTVAPNGGDLPHNNMQPYLVINWCIAMQGVFPPRP